MGWTSKRFREATHQSLTAEQALAFLQDEYYEYQFAMFHFVPAKADYEHHECYMVLRHHEKMKPFILVTIIDIKDGEIYWKEIEESCGPVYTDCPVGFFKYLEAPNNYAKEWRNECKAKKIPFKHISEYC
jgi:hypothetical protein